MVGRSVVVWWRGGITGGLWVEGGFSSLVCRLFSLFLLCRGLSCALSPAELCPRGLPLECVGKYTISQADVDIGMRSNTAYVMSTGPDGSATLSSDENAVDVRGSASVTIGEVFI